MAKDTGQFRRCRVEGCFRAAIADSNLCNAHYDKAIHDMVNYGQSADREYLPAYDDRDGGHNDV
jgi:hypothetical protein